MKKILPVICLLFAIVSCENKTDQTPVYKDFKNDVETKNLYQNIQSIVQKKALIINIAKNKFDELKTSTVYDFNEAGNITKEEIFGDNGRLQLLSEHVYNEQNYIIESNIQYFSTNPKSKVRVVNTYTNDTLLASTKVYRNGILFQESFSTHDTTHDTVKNMIIKDNDTVMSTSKVAYNDAGAITGVTNMSNLENVDSKISNEYDSAQNLVVHKSTMAGLTLKRVHTYKGNILTATKDYTIPPSEEEFLDKITKYDSLFNPIEESHFVDGTLQRVLQFDYEFDAKGNWIKKTSYINRNPEEKGSFKPYILETRDIRYW